MIDTLHITFDDWGDRTASLRDRTDIHPDPRHPDYQGIADAIQSLGYEAVQQEWRSNGVQQYQLLVRGSDGRRNAMKIRGAAYNQHYMRVRKIECNPSSFRTYPQFRQLLETMNAHSLSDIFRMGQVTRIDYSLDYQMPFRTFIPGLYYDYAQTVLAYADIDDSFEEYAWDGGLFSSFRIGRGKKVFKIYDKGLEEWKRQRLAIARQRNRTETPEYEDNADEMEETDAPIPNIQPRSRIELSLSQRNVIRRFWGEVRYTAVLGELDSHLRDIIAGRCMPFRAMLMNRVTFRTSDRLGFEFVDNLRNQRLQHEIESGFLNTVYRRIHRGGGDFWQTTRNVCAIQPWMMTYQPTQTFRRRMRQWMDGDPTFDPQGQLMPDEAYWQSRQTEAPWPLNLTGTPRRR